mgnify:CR=1 FL=1
MNQEQRQKTIEEKRQEVIEEQRQEAIKKLGEEPVTEFTVHSLGEFCDIVDIVADTWRRKVAKRQTKKFNPAPFYCGELSPWFRGVSNADYPCEPKLLRLDEKSLEFTGIQKPIKLNTIEAYFLQRFKTFGTPFLERVPKEDIEWHFLMRHHELPSRLLDWSKGSFIALYFATRKSLENLDSQENLDSNNRKPSSAVWMLEPRRLSEKSERNSRSIYGANRSEHLDIIKKYFPPKGTEIYCTYPLPIIPDMLAPRIQAHVGRFTLHTFNKGGLTEFAENTFDEDKLSYLVKIILPSDKHLAISRSLRSTGVSDMNFTQDLDGLAKELSLRINIGRCDHNRYMDEGSQEQ